MNWLWKWLGYHVCERFTGWRMVRLVGEVRHLSATTGELLWTDKSYRDVQERECVQCGKIQQRSIES